MKFFKKIFLAILAIIIGTTSALFIISNRITINTAKGFISIDSYKASATEASYAPTAYTGGGVGYVSWGNPTNGYSENTNWATATLSTGATSTSAQSPNGDDSNTCAATPSVGTTLWECVNDTDDLDWVTMVTNGGGRIGFTCENPSIPIDASNISVIVRATGKNSGSASVFPTLKVNTTYYQYSSDTYDYTSSFGSHDFTGITTNPARGAAWQYTDINKVGGDANYYLQGFGLDSVDCNPDNLISRLSYLVSYSTTNCTARITYATFGISLGSATITKVEVGQDCYSADSQTLDIYTTADGGTNWSSVHTTSTLPTSDPGTTYIYTDVTADQTWTPTLLNDTNFKIKLVADYSSGGTSPYIWSLDYVFVRVTYTSDAVAITSTPTSKAFGVTNPSSTYYAYGSAPSNPIVDGECFFYIENTGTGQVDLDWHIDDFTGGVGWNIVSTSPGSNEVRITGYYSGQNPASGDYLTNADQDMYENLASGSHIHWDFKLETGTFTDGTAKSSTLTITASAG